MRKCWLYLLITNLLAAVLNIYILKAQEVQINTITHSKLEVEMLDISDGLSQGMIHSVVEDHQGYLWIATKDGLNRYDGARFKIYRNNPNDSLSIAENYIRNLHIDFQGRLWICTQSKGIDLYDPEMDGFIHFRHDPNNPESIGSDRTYRIFSSPEGEIFVWADDKMELEVLKIPKTGVINPSTVEFKNVCERYPFFSSNGSCWFDKHYSPIGSSKDACDYTGNGTLWLFNGTDSVFGFSEEALEGTTTPISLPAVNTYLIGRSNPLRCLIFDPDYQQVYITDGRRRLWRYDQLSDSLMLHVHLPEGYEFAGPVYIDSKQRIWVKSTENQMYRIDPRLTSLEVIQLSSDWIDGNIAAKMIEDRFGNIWIPTGGYGLVKISARREKFKKVDWVKLKGARRSTWPFRIESPENRHFYNDEIFQKWLSCSNSSFLKWQPSIYALESHIVYEGEYRFWFALRPERNKYTPKLISFDCEGQNYETHFVFSIDDPISSHLFIPVFFDQSGAIWCAHHSDDGKAWLQYFNPVTGESEQYLFPVEAGRLHYQFLSDWWQDEEDCWWLATIRGLFRFDPKSSEWQHFSDSDGTTKSLSNNVVLSVCPDPHESEKYVWVGTEGGGLNRVNRNSGQIVHFTRANDLPNDVIYGIQTDQRGNFWLSTNFGLCLFNPQTFEVRNFSESDGLNGNEFNRYQYSKALDGTMYFGGVKGVTVFNPESFYTDSLNTKVVFNGLRILNKPVEFSRFSPDESPIHYKLPKSIEHCRQLIFPHDVGTITLSYSLLDFTVPDRNMFRYQMKGQDKDWIDAGFATEATYTNLSPGDYIFRVMGLNSHHLWSAPTELAITILPPWWGTWWFRVLMVLLVLSVLFALYRYRLAQVVHVERMRNRIAQDLHDEIGSTLSSISLYSAVIKKSANGIPEKSRSILDKISSSTSEMMESMNDIVWTIKADNDHFELVVNRMRAFAVNMTEARGIALDFKVHGNVEKLQINMVARKNLYLIFKEAVNNSVKYANADKISVNILYHHDRLEMVISDNGSGFEMESVQVQHDGMGGNGLRGMKSRAAEMKAFFEVDSRINVGTRIIVRFTIR